MSEHSPRENRERVTIRESVVDTDGRGFYARPVADGGVTSVSNIHVVSLEPGAVRGNHYHESQTEYICVLGGRVRFVAADDETGETIDTEVEGANAPVITIPPGVAHAVKNIGSETNYLLCISDLESGSWKNDIRRRVVLE